MPFSPEPPHARPRELALRHSAGARGALRGIIGAYYAPRRSARAFAGALHLRKPICGTYVHNEKGITAPYFAPASRVLEANPHATCKTPYAESPVRPEGA